MQTVQQLLNEARSSKKALMAVLVDPDHSGDLQVEEFAAELKHAKVDLLFVGGSLLIHEGIEETLNKFRSILDIPVVIFPGHPMQVNPNADAILLLSLISGRNPELLIGQHVHAAPLLKKSGLEILSTGYMLVDGDMPTSVSYISNTQPIPRNKPGIAACTALAGEMLGMDNIYLEAGSGAKQAVPPKMIKAVKEQIGIPLIVGGGIRTREAASSAVQAGADVVVIGSAIERDISIIKDIADAVHDFAVKIS